MAGEGYFSITRKLPPFRSGDPRLRFVFGVHVAERDRELLEALRNALGAGSIRSTPPRKVHWLPSATLTVNSIRAHHASVIPFMERYLLPGAKRRQFELWRQALEAYEHLHPSRWGNGPSTCSVEGCGRPVRGRGLCRSHYYEVTGY